MEAATALKVAADALFKFLGSDFVVKELLSIWENDKEIELLAETVQHIRNLLFDVQRRQIEDKSVTEWYQRLRELFLDAEDFLDKVQTLQKKKDAAARKTKEAEEEIVKPDGKGKRSLAYCCVKIEPLKNTARRFFSSSSNQPKYALEVHNAIKEIKRNFDAITRDIRSFPLLGNEPISRSERLLNANRATTCIVNASEIIGRDGDKDKVVKLLLRPSVDEREISVVSVVGMGGMGKTTVAQLVYDDKSWQQKCQFDERFWVSDSKKYDLKSLLKHILKSIDSEDTSLDNLEEDHLSDRFVDKIQGKSFLLVLDDVDCEDGSNWENLMKFLKKGNKEKSRVLVTTRSRKVADVVGSLSDSTYELEGLSRKDSMDLFKRHASTKRRDGILAEIVEKCHGVPLALKVIGSLLRGADAIQWQNFRDCKSLADIADESDKENKLIRILKISYDDLDPIVKQCFSFCALFPKNFLIRKEILSSMWVDNIHFETKKGETLESVCDKMLRILYNRCFLEKWNTEDGIPLACRALDEFGDATHFKMHDLMCDLAKNVAGEEILQVDPNPIGVNFIVEEKVRHLFLTDGSAPKFQPKGKGKRLRSLIGFPKTMELSSILSDCPTLRLLDIGDCCIDTLPSSMGNLIHLRYLCLSYNGFSTLPDSVCELINLKHLNLSSCGLLSHLPSRIGALTSLQVLNIDYCYSLEELPSSIVNLVNLRHLSLCSCRIVNPLSSGMDALTSLQVLDICGCNNSGFENLSSSLGKLINMQFLCLTDHKIQTLPDSICELINLKRLNLRDCVALRRMPSEMGALTSLQVLHVRGCEILEELPSSIVNLNSLSHLFLHQCKALSHLPFGMDALRSLQMLVIWNCPELKVPSCIGKMFNLRHLSLHYEGSHLPFGVGALTSLEGLYLDCANLVEFPIGIEKLSNLRQLSLHGFESLARMPSGMGALLPVWHEARFIVGDPDSSCAQLEELLPLSDFPANLRIELSTNFRLKAPTTDGEAFLLNKKSLRNLEIVFRPDEYGCSIPPRRRNRTGEGVDIQQGVDMAVALEMQARVQDQLNLQRLVHGEYKPMTFPPDGYDDYGCSIPPGRRNWNGTEEEVPYHMDILAKLQPPPNLESFSLYGYQCMTFPPYGYDFASVLPNLVDLRLTNCNKVRYLTFMRTLKCLARFELRDLSSLEYIEENVSAASFCFPRLNSFVLERLPKLKGWCGGLADGVNEDDSESFPSYPRISDVQIRECYNLEPLHLLSTLNIFDVLTSFDFKTNRHLVLSLHGPSEHMALCINRHPVTKATGRYMVEIFRARFGHLTRLWILECRLKTLPGLQHLTALQELIIKFCPDFTWEEEEDEEEKQSVRDDEIQSTSLHTTHHPHVSCSNLTSLKSLILVGLPSMARLPEWIQFLPSLQWITIDYCENLLIPEWLHRTFEYRDIRNYSFGPTAFRWEKKETELKHHPRLLRQLLQSTYQQEVVFPINGAEAPPPPL